MKYLKDDFGNSSSTRLMFVIGLSWSMVVSTVFTWFFKWSAAEFVLVFTTTNGTFIALKLGQKSMEPKNTTPLKTDKNETNS